MNLREEVDPEDLRTSARDITIENDCYEGSSKSIQNLIHAEEDKTETRFRNLEKGENIAKEKNKSIFRGQSPLYNLWQGLKKDV